MRRIQCVFLSLIIILSNLCSVAAYADERTDRDSKEASESYVGSNFLNNSTVLYDYKDSNTPNDAFDGDFAEYHNKDGSVTYVADNGTVGTDYPDGTSVAVDYKGNEYSWDKNGNYTVKTVTGYTIKGDGEKKVLTQPGGLTTTFNSDGSYTEDLDTFGMRKTYDADSNLISIGFIGGDEQLKVVDGRIEEGTIHGPNGASYTYDSAGLHAVSPNGDVFDEKYSSDWAEHTSSTETSLKWSNGASYTEKNTTTESKGRSTEKSIITSSGTELNLNNEELYEDGRKTEELETTLARWVNENGDICKLEEGSWSSWDENGQVSEFQKGRNIVTVSFDGSEYTNADQIQIKVGEDGKPTGLDGGCETWKGSDGSAVLIDKLSPLTIYKDDNFTVYIDKDGVLRHYEDKDGNYIKTEYDENGKVINTTVSVSDGSEFIHTGDGQVVITLPSGDVIATDGNGKVFKNGIRAEQAEGDLDYPEQSDIYGTWENVSISLSNVDSVFVKALVRFLANIFGNDTVDVDEVAKEAIEIDENATANFYIEEGSKGKVKIYLYADEGGGYSVYEGKYKDGEVNAKLVDTHIENGEAASIPVSKLRFKFSGGGNYVYLSASGEIDNFLLSADIEFNGEKSVGN